MGEAPGGPRPGPLTRSRANQARQAEAQTIVTQKLSDIPLPELCEQAQNLRITKETHGPEILTEVPTRLLSEHAASRAYRQILEQVISKTMLTTNDIIALFSPTEDYATLYLHDMQSRFLDVTNDLKDIIHDDVRKRILTSIDPVILRDGISAAYRKSSALPATAQKREWRKIVHIQNVSPDGNCFFHCIANIIMDLGPYNINYATEIGQFLRFITRWMAQVLPFSSEFREIHDELLDAEYESIITSANITVKELSIPTNACPETPLVPSLFSFLSNGHYAITIFSRSSPNTCEDSTYNLARHIRSERKAKAQAYIFHIQSCHYVFAQIDSQYFKDNRNINLNPSRRSAIPDNADKIKLLYVPSSENNT